MRIVSSWLPSSKHEPRRPRPGRDRHAVFGARLTPSGRLLASRYRPVLEGRPAIISFVTVAELEYGARLAGWGPDRLRRLEREIARAEIVWPGPNLTQAYASLRAWCVRTGHDLERMKPSPYRIREAVSLLDAEHAECVLFGDSTTDVLVGVAVIGYADKPGKAQALVDVQAAVVTTNLAEITTALRNTA